MLHHTLAISTSFVLLSGQYIAHSTIMNFLIFILITPSITFFIMLICYNTLAISICDSLK